MGVGSENTDMKPLKTAKFSSPPAAPAAGFFPYHIETLYLSGARPESQPTDVITLITVIVLNIDISRLSRSEMRVENG